ncbi:TonB-linked outer membrane protein, SusC/RagA family [Parapedobacter luteus]|uniref:TonB-linked outer membrane protein, SusC/RagA family n=1 Tax=Parapedobacter luteus TaxID=623280 RepID=A0A1T5D8P0_9SPHI|nr:TonB-dependent receptor [Parapedobacter luteus]SKB67870.1 TonB-linked outer membrane protein, SusC/RagA family [Parapedobacter luteus]
MKEKLLCFFMLGIALIGSVHAQDRRISGSVTASDDGAPIAGVSVLAVGTSVATQTDASGTYTINVPSTVKTLEFRFLGYISRTVEVGSSNVLNVVMTVDATALSEVVVTGYGTQERRDLTGSIGTVKGEAFQNVALPSFDKFLQGQVSGVQASTPSGILGQAARVRIRGTNSISNSAEPLYVVDGLPYVSGNWGSGNAAYNPLGDINPNDIESVEVLKDGSATAIYGSRAANGVILITTKKGKSGAAQLTYDGWIASTQPAKRFDLLNADEFIAVNNQKAANTGVTSSMANPTLNPETNEPYNTDWQDIVFRTGFQQNHALSFSGATPTTSYYFSLGYSDLQGITVNNDQTRYQLRTNLEHKTLNNYLTLGVTGSLSHTTNTGLNTGAGALSGNVNSAVLLPPNVPAVWPDGTYNLNPSGTALGSGANLFNTVDNRTNLQYVLDHNWFDTKSLNFTGSTFADVKITDGLNLRTQISLINLNTERFQYQNPDHGDGRGSNGVVYNYYSRFFRYNWLNTLTYNKQVGIHKIGFVGGYEAQKSFDNNFFGQGIDLAHTFFGEKNIISGTFGTQNSGGGYEERSLTSLFGRLNYSVLDRYLLTATLRHDKISSLPWGNQGATLPGISLGWRLSEEGFFKNADGLSFIDDLKIRGGYAEVGNVEIGAFPYAGVYAPRLYGDISGFFFSQVGNPDLTFETSKKTNVGLDLSLFASRVTLTADWFQNDVDNLILAVPVPPSQGIPGNEINTNVGRLNNKGWEFTLNTTNIHKTNFSWTSNLNLTFVKNEITQLAGAPLVNTYHRTEVGRSIAEFFGYEYYGVNPANGYPVFVQYLDGVRTLAQIHPQDGSWSIFHPNDPSNTSQTTRALNAVEDKIFLGQSNPTWYGGFNNTLNYKNFDSSLFLTFAGGHKVYNLTRQSTLTTQSYANNSREMLNAWTPENPNTDVPILWAGQTNRLNQAGHLNSRFLEDGKYLRFQNISLGYRLPQALLSRINVNNARIYASVQNAFVITGYSGIDPEIANSVTTNRAPSLDDNVNPVPRTFTFGINLSL